MRERLLIAALGVLMIGCGKQTVSSADCEESPTIAISMVELILNGQAYEGSCISATGYLSHHNPRLYLTKDHSLINDSLSSIYIVDRTEEGDVHQNCGDNYVTVTGRLVAISKISVGIDEIKSVFKYGEIEGSGYCYGNI
tara:strand:- start:43 stop:462 length:420 start_codon:yes stop_codon:yes gene_type:complete